MPRAAKLCSFPTRTTNGPPAIVSLIKIIYHDQVQETKSKEWGTASNRQASEACHWSCVGLGRLSVCSWTGRGTFWLL